MLPLLVATLLTQAPEAPPDAVKPPVHLVADDDGGAAHHFAATFTGALLGAAPGAVLLGLAYRFDQNGNPPAALGTGILGLALVPTGLVVGATMGHVLSGGRGSLGTAVISAGVSTALSAVALGLFVTQVGEPDWTPDQRAKVFGPAAAVALLVPVLATTVALQVEHHRAFQISATPLPGGAAVAVSGAF